MQPVEASGVGQITGNDLTVTYTYDPATNTLTDISGVVWYRQG